MSDWSKWIRTAVALVALVTVAGAARAEVAVGVKAGTLGLGAEVTWDLGERVALRGGVAGWQESLSYEASDIEYEGDLEIRDATALLDFYPTGGGFRLTAGLAWNDHRLVGSAPLASLLRQPGVLPPGSLIPVNLGTLRGEATVDSVGPYVGFGFGRATRGGRFGASVDLGVVFHGDPQVELEADSEILDRFPELQVVVAALLAQEEADLEREATDYRYFPVISLTFSYRF